VRDALVDHIRTQNALNVLSLAIELDISVVTLFFCYKLLRHDLVKLAKVQKLLAADLLVQSLLVPGVSIQVLEFVNADKAVLRVKIVENFEKLQYFFVTDAFFDILGDLNLFKLRGFSCSH
jgi:aspartate carbamoyltransferase regulatory subunit